MEDKVNVLSLFDGMSCGQIALNRVGIKYDNYFASEIDKYAIKVTQHNFPNTKQIGDVTKVKASDLPKINLLIGGSPCQGFSFAGKQLNFDDPRSKLFFEYARILNEIREVNPDVKFLLENVRMKQEFQNIISKYLGVKPIQINSSLVSAQNRVRLYWTNIPNIQQPKDKKIILKDILESNVNEKYYLPSNISIRLKDKLIKLIELDKKSFCISATTAYLERNYRRSLCNLVGILDIKGNDSIKRVYSVDSKCPSLTTMQGGNRQPKILDNIKFRIRKITPLECERLQTVPDNYTNNVSDSQRYKMLGNGWTVDVIAHIFKNLKK